MRAEPVPTFPHPALADRRLPARDVAGRPAIVRNASFEGKSFFPGSRPAAASLTTSASPPESGTENPEGLLGQPVFHRARRQKIDPDSGYPLAIVSMVIARSFLLPQAEGMAVAGTTEPVSAGLRRFAKKEPKKGEAPHGSVAGKLL